jgi:hypothetical protein
MQQLDLQRIAYDIRIVPPTKGERKKSKLLKILRPSFLSLILFAVIASGVFLAANSPEVRQWLAGLEQNGVLPSGARSFIDHLSPLARPEN